MAREARRISFSLNYANYAGIFNHRRMEKDKLSILDVWGAYGQKDIEILDRSGPACSEINKPAMAADLLIKRKQFLVYTNIFYYRSMEKDKLFVLDVCGH